MHDANHIIVSEISTHQVSSALSVPTNQAYSDSACSRPLLIPRSKIHLISNLTGKGGAKIKTASGHTIISTDSGKFIIGKENIPVDIMEDEDLMHAILGLGPLANLDYTIVLNKKGMVVSKDGIELINSTKSPTAVLWPMDLEQPLETTGFINLKDIDECLVSLAITHSGHADFAKFVSSAMGSPADSTLLKALRKGYIVWPHFTASMLANNPTNLMATHKGHLDAIPSWTQSSTKKTKNQKRKEARKRMHLLGELLKLVQGNSTLVNVNPTTIQDVGTLSKEDEIRKHKIEDEYQALTGKWKSFADIMAMHGNIDNTFILETMSEKESNTMLPIIEDSDDVYDDERVFTKIAPLSELADEIKAKIIAQSDATGKYPTPGVSRNNYVLITVHKNYIKYTPFQSRSAQDYVKAFDSMISFFRLHGKAFKIVRMDNETSTLLEEYFTRSNVTPEYVAPGDHRTLTAERAIRTAKNHLISIMASADEDCPKSLWDEATSYAEITLNLMRPFYGNDSISAYEGVIGHPYDISKSPLCVFGTKTLAFNPPGERGSWSDHGTPTYYIGPSLQHYRSHRVYDPKTRRISSNNNLAFYHRKLLMPGSSLGDRFTASIKDLSIILKQIGEGKLLKPEDNQQFKDSSTTLVEALQNLSDIFVSPPIRTEQTQDRSAIIQRMAATAPQPIAIVQRVLPIMPPPVPINNILPLQRVVSDTRVEDASLQRVVASTPPPAISERLANLRTIKRAANLQHVDLVNITQNESSNESDNNLTALSYTDSSPQEIASSAELHIDGERVDIPDILMSAIQTLSADNLSGGKSKRPTEDFLNLDKLGNPLTYASALADPDRHDDFVIASYDEWDKFLRRRNACMPLCLKTFLQIGAPISHTSVIKQRKKSMLSRKNINRKYASVYEGTRPTTQAINRPM